MRILIVANRLPITVTHKEGKLSVTQSSGGLVSSLTSYLENLNIKKSEITDYLWIGWPGHEKENGNKDEALQAAYEKAKVVPVNLTTQEKSDYYDGFCNNIIWPLFHYFPTYCDFNPLFWDSYQKINQRFANEVLKEYRSGDLVFIQDYHLFLLPQLLRKEKPGITIGFFLHIPFPSYEVFRIMPAHWRQEILQGMLGSNLIGFHTQDYMEYFLRCVARILGLEHQMGKIIQNNHTAEAITLPLGINFEQFNNSTKKILVKKEISKLKKIVGKNDLVLSLDRLDYTKGILNRLLGYEMFLAKNLKFHKKVVLILIMVPSRQTMAQYEVMKQQVEQQIGEINGRFGSLDWVPIIYQYRHLNFAQLASLYNLAQVALVTPLRDGMNLVAKEYLSTKSKGDGVLILSEMAGSAQELKEAVIINPNSPEEIAQSLATALAMSKKEQLHRNKPMRERLRYYSVENWANEVIVRLIESKNLKIKPNHHDNNLENLFASFKKAQNRLIFLDYDGTLSPFFVNPFTAKPTKNLLDLLKQLATQSVIFLTSGRDSVTMEKWFGKLPINLVAEHGAFIREKEKIWQKVRDFDTEWKKTVLPIIERYTDRVPGSFIEEKVYSVAWHYRGSNEAIANDAAIELADDLRLFTVNANLQVLQANKVLEIKNSQFNKGSAGFYAVQSNRADFIMAIGDDVTDEDLFKILPAKAFSIKVGEEETAAKVTLKSYTHVLKLLNRLSKIK